jgi:lipopolysaccharide biosynthesis glycosyltransferase
MITTKTNKQLEIPVVFITDNNYVIPTAVAIRSLVLNKKPKTIYKIYVVITENVTAKNKRKLTKCGRRKAQVSLIECDTSVLNEYVVPGYYVLPCALLKFNIPGLLPQYEKILYLDGDILVNGDLSELYSTDISGAYLGAVSDMPAVGFGFHKRLGTAIISMQALCC